MGAIKLNYQWIWRTPLILFEIFWALLTMYIVSALFGMLICVGGKYVPAEGGVKIYLRSDGIHSDLILPVENELKDWSKVVLRTDVRTVDSTRNYIAFGWGDQGFFLNTPEWSDLKFATAFNALFYRGKSALHVVYSNEPEVRDNCFELVISKDNYYHLVKYIEAAFHKDGDGRALVIKDRGYWENDAFFQAKGSYGLFSTCNSWINGGLKVAGLPACFWTPFSFGFMNLYR